MPNCPKCGNEVNEEMAFCPKCGASLKGEQPRDVEEWGKEFGKRMSKRGKELGERMSERGKEIEERIKERTERAERYEKYEKEEKEGIPEKYEPRRVSFLGPLIGGLILIFLGLMFYLQVIGRLEAGTAWALFFVVIGVIVIAAGLSAATMARRRHPAP